MSPEVPEPPLPGALEAVGAWRLFVRRTPVLAGTEPALYVHGLGGASTNWTDLMRLLAPRLAGVAPDLPGFGRSDPPAGYGLDVHAAAVTALLERAGPAHLLGNSLGGAVATRVAAERPDLVRTLTLLAPALPTYRPRRTNLGLPLLAVPGVEPMLARRLAGTAPAAQVQAVLRMCYARPTRVHPQRVAEAEAELRRRAGLGHARPALVESLRGLLAAYLVRGRRNLWRQAAAVRAPTLLVFGRADRLVGLSTAYRAARTFRDARLVVLDDAGHVPQLEWPRAVAEAVLDHLDAARGAGVPIS